MSIIGDPTFVGETLYEIEADIRMKKFNTIIFGFFAIISIALLYLSLAFVNPDITMEPYTSIKLNHVLTICGLLGSLIGIITAKKSIKKIYEYSKFLGVFAN